MKTLVIYDGRHGFTEHCVGLLAAELPPGADLWPVRSRPGTPDWTAYDAIVFGGPVYLGRWSGALRAFLTRHGAALASHRPLAAFIVSLSPKAAARKYFETNLPPALGGKPGHLACFGGQVTWKNLTWVEQVLLKWDRGIETDAGNLDLAEIQALAAWLRAKGPAE